MDGIEIGMEYKASLPSKSRSGGWALAEGQWEAIKGKFSVQMNFGARSLQSQVGEWIRPG